MRKKFFEDINAINTSGGKDLFQLLKAIMNNINIKDDKEKIIIMTTGVAYNGNNELWKLFKKWVEEKRISITIIEIIK